MPKKPKDVVAPTAPIAPPVTDVLPGSLKARGGLPFLHIGAAISLTNQCMEVGKQYDEDTSAAATNAQKATYRACVIGTLFTTVAFLEAAINEVFLDTVESIPENARIEKDTSVTVADNDVNPYGVVESLVPIFKKPMGSAGFEPATSAV